MNIESLQRVGEIRKQISVKQELVKKIDACVLRSQGKVVQDEKHYPVDAFIISIKGTYGRLLTLPPEYICDLLPALHYIKYRVKQEIEVLEAEFKSL